MFWWQWLGLCWIVLGVGLIAFLEQAASLSDEGIGPLVLSSTVFVVGAPFIVIWILGVCIQILWQGRIPITGRVWWPARAEALADKYPLPLSPADEDPLPVSRLSALCQMIEIRQRKEPWLRRQKMASNWMSCELSEAIEASILDTVEQYLWLRDGGLDEHAALKKIDVFQNGTAEFSLKPDATLGSYIAHRLAADGSNYLAIVNGGLDDVILAAENWARDEIPRVKSEPPFPPADWLQGRITVSDIEKGAGFPSNRSEIAGTTTDGRVVRQETTIKNYSEWRCLELRMLPTDELWTFSSPIEHWQRLVGSRGVVLTRNGHPIGHVITLMN
jgi:hypothetical protein